MVPSFLFGSWITDRGHARETIFMRWIGKYSLAGFLTSPRIGSKITSDRRPHLVRGTKTWLRNNMETVRDADRDSILLWGWVHAHTPLLVFHGMSQIPKETSGFYCNFQDIRFSKFRQGFQAAPAYCGSWAKCSERTDCNGMGQWEEKFVLYVNTKSGCIYEIHAYKDGFRS